MVCRGVPSAPYSFLPHTPFHPSLAPVRPIFPTAPASLQPQPPVRPRLASALGSLPPQPALRACVRVLGVSEFSPAEAKCGGAVRVSWLTSMRGACAALRRLPDSSVAELPGGTSLRWSTPSIAPTANDLRQELELTRWHRLARTSARSDTHTVAHARTHAVTRTHFTLLHTHSTHTYTRARACTCAHTCTHTRARMHVCTRTRSHDRRKA